jgi:HK97 gp10 family phage protein
MAASVRLVFDNRKLIFDEIRAQADLVVRKTGLDIVADAKQSIQDGNKTGAMYGEHQASAPGEAPATDVGSLVNSIWMVDEEVGDAAVQVVVGSEYGEALELGSVHMEPRPFLHPAADRAKPGFEQAMKEVLADV